MAENRLTFHSGYRDKNGKAYNAKHNQRENFEKPKNADKNKYWDYQQWGTETFSESESLFYKQAFGNHVKAHNEKCKKRRQYARCMTIEQYTEKHPPEEVLIYLGTENVDEQALVSTFEDFREYIKRECNTDTCGIELLNAALHMDETTPHIHIRQVYWYTNKDGNAEISQNKALEGLGFKRPDETSKSGRFNNAKQTFTAACRAKLFEIAKSHGVELIETPLPKKEVGLPIDEYREREQAREAWKQEQETMETSREAWEQEQQEQTDKLNELQQGIAYTEEYKSFVSARKQESLEKERKTALMSDEDDEHYEVINIDWDEEEEHETQSVREAPQIALETLGTIYSIPNIPKSLTPFLSKRVYRVRDALDEKLKVVKENEIYRSKLKSALADIEDDKNEQYEMDL